MWQHSGSRVKNENGKKNNKSDRKRTDLLADGGSGNGKGRQMWQK